MVDKIFQREVENSKAPKVRDIKEKRVQNLNEYLIRENVRVNNKDAK